MPAEDAPRTVRDLVRLGRAFLDRKGIASARLETELLVAHALGTDRLHVFLQLDRPVSPAEIADARSLLVRRGEGAPCAYLTGTREFYGRDFEVRPGVLIPRPETELLVDLARERLESPGAARVLDLGTGSGCLAITIALECPGARVTATDLSAEALHVARANAARLGAQLELLMGDGLEPVRGRSFDLVVCNPPYIDPAGADDLPRDVREHEPPEALFAPAGDPDHWVRRLVASSELAAPRPVLLIELGFDQGARLRPWLNRAEVRHTLHRDLAGVERVLELAPAPAPGAR